MRAVKFLRNWKGYSGGEIAGFESAELLAQLTKPDQIGGPIAAYHSSPDAVAKAEGAAGGDLPVVTKDEPAPTKRGRG